VQLGEPVGGVFLLPQVLVHRRHFLAGLAGIGLAALARRCFLQRQVLLFQGFDHEVGKEEGCGKQPDCADAGKSDAVDNPLHLAPHAADTAKLTPSFFCS
jgi:hypothetical protein